MGSPPHPSQLKALKAKVSARLKQPELFRLLADTFAALGDHSRVKIVFALSQGDLRVTEIAEWLEMSQPQVSQHLRILRDLRLVQVRKEGRNSFYSLDDEHIHRLLNEGIEHVEDLIK